jgi:hypothetical protein
MAGGQAAVARTGLWPYQGIPYSMSSTNTPTGHRADCSGFVSMCWDMPVAGEDTQSFVAEGWMVEIPREQLQPGDAIGECGWGTLGANGHIQLVESYDPWTGLCTYWEQNGGQSGPSRRHNYYINSGYQAYRFTGTVAGNIEEEEDMTPEQNDLLRMAEAKANNAGAVAFGFANGDDTTDQCVIAYGGALGQPLGPVDLTGLYDRVADEVMERLRPGSVYGHSHGGRDRRGAGYSDDWPPRRPGPRPRPGERRPRPETEEYANIAYPADNR